MKKLVFVALIFSSIFTGCFGFSSVNSESLIQPKSIQNETPIICPDVKIVHGSLGILRNGKGSYSTQDIDAVIPSDSLVKVVQKAIDSGYFLNMTYNTKRFPICNSDHILNSVTIVKE